MSAPSNPVRIRLLLDVDNYRTAPTDLITSQSVVIPTGADLRFELMGWHSFLGAFADGTKLDWTNITGMSISLQDTASTHNEDTYWTVTVLNAAVANTVTAAAWTAGTAQQITAAITAAQNALVLPSNAGWLCISASTNGATKIYATATAFAVGDIIKDTNGNGQQCTTAGTSGGSAPSWNVTLGGTTADGSVTWTNVTLTAKVIPLSTFPVTIFDTGLPIGTPIVATNYTPAGSGSPEGVISGSPGYPYTDTTNGAIYFKITGTGNTGWQKFVQL